MRPHGSPAELERRRLRALELLQEGLQPHVVAQRLGVDRRSVRRWKRTYPKAGPRWPESPTGFGPACEADLPAAAKLGPLDPPGSTSLGVFHRPVDLSAPCSVDPPALSRRLPP